MSSGAERLRLALASALGLGLAPVAPGSFGALLGVVLHLAIATQLPPAWHQAALLLALAAVTAVHWVLTPWAQAYWKQPDPPHFVLDEVAGYLVVPILFPFGPLWATVLWGFVLFRVFDIIKLPIARQIDRSMHGALGVVLDDIVSGAYAALALYGLRAAGAHADWLPWR